MRMRFFGDSYDVVKRFLLQSLAPTAKWTAFPMFTHVVTPDEVAAFEAFLGVQVASRGVLATDTDRAKHLAVPPGHHHVFLDPDTGIKLKPCTGESSTRYVFGPELIELCTSETGRLVLVFDQSVARGRERESMSEKLGYFREHDAYGFAYLSHACFVVLSGSEEVCGGARDRLLASNLPAGRILEARVPNNGIQQRPAFGGR